jgi:hypothetical protein
MMQIAGIIYFPMYLLLVNSSFIQLAIQPEVVETIIYEILKI